MNSFITLVNEFLYYLFSRYYLLECKQWGSEDIILQWH